MTEPDFKDWLMHPQTKEFKKQLYERISGYKEGMANGSTLVIDNPYATHAYTAGIKGKIEEINEIIDLMIEGE